MLILYVFVDGNEEILTTNSWESQTTLMIFISNTYYKGHIHMYKKKKNLLKLTFEW